MSLPYPSILVGYMEPKEVWLSYCQEKERNITVHTQFHVLICDAEAELYLKEKK